MDISIFFRMGYIKPGFSPMEFDTIHKHKIRKESIRKIFRILS